MRRVIVSGLVALIGVALWVAPAGASKSSDNGEATKNPKTILADATIAMTQSGAFRVAGAGTSGGQRVALNLVSAHGAGGGTIGANGETFTFVVTPPNLYVTMNAATWTKLVGDPLAGQLFGGKWVQTTSADKDFAPFLEFLDASKFSSNAFLSQVVAKGAVTTFRGKRVVPLKDGQGGTAFVAAVGPPYILGIVNTHKGDGGQILFSQYRTAKAPTAPRNSISLSQLEQAGGSS